MDRLPEDVLRHIGSPTVLTNVVDCFSLAMCCKATLSACKDRTDRARACARSKSPHISHCNRMSERYGDSDLCYQWSCVRGAKDEWVRDIPKHLERIQPGQVVALTIECATADSGELDGLLQAFSRQVPRKVLERIELLHIRDQEYGWKDDNLHMFYNRHTHKLRDRHLEVFAQSVRFLMLTSLKHVSEEAICNMKMLEHIHVPMGQVTDGEHYDLLHDGKFMRALRHLNLEGSLSYVSSWCKRGDTRIHDALQGCRCLVSVSYYDDHE